MHVSCTLIEKHKFVACLSKYYHAGVCVCVHNCMSLTLPARACLYLRGTRNTLCELSTLSPHCSHSSALCWARERNPNETHPSLFLFSCLNSNHRELPYRCGKARCVCVCVWVWFHSMNHECTIRAFSSKSRKPGIPFDMAADVKRTDRFLHPTGSAARVKLHVLLCKCEYSWGSKSLKDVGV